MRGPSRLSAALEGAPVYAKVFRSLWDGTLADSWEAWALFVFLLAHADAEGFVDMTPQAIARRSSMPLDAVRRGIEVLEAPDQDSRSDAEDGRRLVRIDPRRPWGWRIVNARYYRGLTDAETVRESARVRQADRRRRDRFEASQRHGESHAVTASHTRSRQAEAEEEAEGSTPSSLRSEGAGEPLSGGVGFQTDLDGYPLVADGTGLSGHGRSASGLADGPAAGAGGVSCAGMDSEPGPGGPGSPEPATEAGGANSPSLTDRLALGGPEAAGRARMLERGLGIPAAGHKPDWVPTEAMLAEWRAAFPGVDIEAQIRAMRTWSLTHLSQRKTMRGMPAFVNRWLSTEQDKLSRGAGAARSGRSHRAPADARYLEQNRHAVGGAEAGHE